MRTTKNLNNTSFGSSPNSLHEEDIEEDDLEDLPKEQPTPSNLPPPPLHGDSFSGRGMAHNKVLNMCPFLVFYCRPADDFDTYIKRFEVAPITNQLFAVHYLTILPGNFYEVVAQ